MTVQFSYANKEEKFPNNIPQKYFTFSYTNEENFPNDISLE